MELVLAGVIACLAGYAAGRLTAGSKAAFVVGLTLLAVLLAVPVVVGQPWLVVAAALGLVPGYVRGGRVRARGTDLVAAPRSITLGGSHQVSAAVRRPTHRPHQQAQG